MKTNSITSTNFQAQIKINCPRDLITSSQIEALTKQAANIGKETDTVVFNITKHNAESNKNFYNAVNVFNLAGEKFQTSSSVFYKENGYFCKSKSPYNYIERQLIKLSELI